MHSALHINVEIKEFGSTTSCSRTQAQLWLFTRRKFLRKWVKEIESEVRNKEYISLFLSEIMTSKKEVMKEVSKKKEKALRLNSPYLTFNSLQKTPFFTPAQFLEFFFWLRSPVKRVSSRAAFFRLLKRSYFKSLLIDRAYVGFLCYPWFSPLTSAQLKNVPWDRRVIGCS